MAGALDGIRVIDFGQWLAGPLTALLLADQGAEVIHVDPPGGPFWKTVTNATAGGRPADPWSGTYAPLPHGRQPRQAHHPH